MTERIYPCDMCGCYWTDLEAFREHFPDCARNG
jgi:hypothetical protein